MLAWPATRMERTKDYGLTQPNKTPSTKYYLEKNKNNE
jgi:hypothetical protein